MNLTDLIIPIYVGVSVMMIVGHSIFPREGSRRFVTYQSCHLLLFGGLSIIWKQGIITGAEVVIFLILFLVFAALFIKVKADTRQLTELKNRLVELEKIAGIYQPAEVAVSEKTA